MLSNYHHTANQQKQAQAERLLALREAKEVRMVKLANIIEDAVVDAEGRGVTETAEQYLIRLGVDVTTI